MKRSRRFSALRKVVPLLAVPVVVATAATGASAEPGDESWRIQEIQTSMPLVDQPCNVEPGPDGAMWFIEHGANRIGRIDLESGDIKKFDLPTKINLPYVGDVLPTPSPFSQGPCDINFADDGNLWFNHQLANQVGFMKPEPPYDMTMIDLPTPASIPMSLDRGADNAVYATLTGANKIARIDLETHKVTEFDVPTPVSGIIGGFAGNDGHHWFVEIVASKLLKFNYKTHEMTEYPLPSKLGTPFVVRVFDDGVWFTQSATGSIGHFDPKTEKFTTITIPTAVSFPVGLDLGADGDIYTDLGLGDKIARIDRKTKKVIKEYPIPTKVTFADEIKRGPDNAIYVTEFFSGKIARLWVDSFGKDPGFPSGTK